MEPKHDAIMVTERADISAEMSPVMAAILAQNPDAETLRKLMDMKREEDAEEARKAFNRALVRLKADMPTVVHHDAVVKFEARGSVTEYGHSTLAGIVDAVGEHLSAHGFTLTSRASTPGRDAVEVTTVLAHTEGHSESMTMTAPIDTSGSKNPIQGIASTTSYLRRYQSLMLLGIATRDGPEEPTGPQASAAKPIDVVDPAKNRKAMGWLHHQHGIDKDAAEAHVGRPITEWRAEELAKLKAWVQPTDTPEAPASDVAEYLEAIAGHTDAGELDAWAQEHNDRIRQLGPAEQQVRQAIAARMDEPG